MMQKYNKFIIYSSAIYLLYLALSFLYYEIYLTKYFIDCLFFSDHHIGLDAALQIPQVFFVV